LREASSLSGISHDGIAEIVDFVERHIEVLLQLLLREEGVLGGNARTDQFGRQLEVLGRETMGRFQTPQCVSSPKILPPPDMSDKGEKRSLLVRASMTSARDAELS
jgi:hypothetical protein